MANRGNLVWGGCKGIAHIGRMFCLSKGITPRRFVEDLFLSNFRVIRLDFPLLCKGFAGTMDLDYVHCIIEAAGTRSQRIFFPLLKNLSLGSS